MPGMVWYWIGGALSAGMLTAWIKLMALRPGMPGWLRKISVAPFVVLFLSVGVAVYFTFKTYSDLEAADASEKASLMAQNITWAMHATLAGAIGLGAIAVLLVVLSLRRRRGA